MAKSSPFGVHGSLFAVHTPRLVPGCLASSANAGTLLGQIERTVNRELRTANGEP
jgi:hypothetical protein